MIVTDDGTKKPRNREKENGLVAPDAIGCPGTDTLAVIAPGHPAFRGTTAGIRRSADSAADRSGIRSPRSVES